MDTGSVPMDIVIIMNTAMKGTGIAMMVTGGHGRTGTTTQESTHTCMSMEDITVKVDT
jgi:hypothetical protein